MNNSLIFSCLVGLSLTTGCGSSSDSDSPSDGPSVFGLGFSLVSGQPTVDSMVDGTGILSFGDSLVLERATETNFLMTMDLSAADSFVNLHSFADSSLGNSQIIGFSKDSNDSLVMTYSKKDGTEGSLSTFNQTVDTSQPFTFSVDIHNGEDNGSHVIVWVGDEIPAEPTEFLDGFFGQGKFVGLAIQNAKVGSFKVGAAEAAD